MSDIGLGDKNYRVAIYIANRPPIDEYPSLAELRPLLPGEVQHIVTHTSNHWRKLFNVAAKFRFELGVNDAETWQDYRDNQLLQPGSDMALLFSAPTFSRRDGIHIVAGKTYAADLGLTDLDWLDRFFAINRSQRLLVSPYLDYRQLSNQRISQLVDLVRELQR